MAREKEIKVDLKIPVKDFEERIKSNGYNLTQTLEQEDIYFDTKDWELYHHESSLRLRKINNKPQNITFKKMFCIPSNEDNWYLDELETPFTNPELAVLEKISLRLRIRLKTGWIETDRDSVVEFIKYLKDEQLLDEQHMKKTRTVFKKDGTEIVMDNVEHVGVVVEIETQKDNPAHRLKELLSEDEWERSFKGTSYLLLQNVKGLPDQKQHFERFKKEPDWNVWENERELYERLIKKRDY
jgi:adenylate cyclase class IV